MALLCRTKMGIRRTRGGGPSRFTSCSSQVYLPCIAASPGGDDDSARQLVLAPETASGTRHTVVNEHDCRMQCRSRGTRQVVAGGTVAWPSCWNWRAPRPVPVKSDVLAEELDP